MYGLFAALNFPNKDSVKQLTFPFKKVELDWPWFQLGLEKSRTSNPQWIRMGIIQVLWGFFLALD